MDGDLKPFKHGSEGTHHCCKRRFKHEGGKATCCSCTFCVWCTPKICPYCKQEFIRGTGVSTKYWLSKKYCSKKCFYSVNRGEENARYVHGLRDHRFRAIWKGINARCNNKNNNRFKDYGGRGVKCLWPNILIFRDDMFAGYLEHAKKFGEKNTTIDRINNDGNYSKQNCRWATKKEQYENKRSLHFIEFMGEKKTIAEWAREKDLEIATLGTRIKRGWPVDRALNTASMIKRK